MSLVERALASPPDDIENFLREACGDDTALLEQVRTYVQWERRLDGFLAEPVYPREFLEHPFKAGDVLLGRFRIEREIAHGGMGIVYEAYDERLARRIALKCARTGFRKRLPPEVRHASDVAHPNVCKIFEIHTTSTDHGDVDFLTMEFLDGETLAERLRKGPLEYKEAKSIALQLCAGLAEAHRQQVIHGDLKSSNIILVRDGSATRAVITDFGLARRPNSVRHGIQSMDAAGTPDYMAPELWKGVKPSVATDIYALGVILQEVSGGKQWSRLIACCLHSNPERRYKTAEEIANAIEPWWRRWSVAAAAAVIFAVGTGVATYETVTAPHETVRLAMLPLEASPDGLSAAVANQVRTIKGNQQRRFVPVAFADVVSRHVDSPEKARTQLGATHVLQARLEAQNGDVLLHAKIIETRSQVATKEWTVKYARGELRYVPVALAGYVTGTLHLPALVDRAAIKPAAQQDYSNGLIYMRLDSGVDSALVSLQRAVAADPDTPLTHAALAEAYWWKYSITKDRTYLAQADASVSEAQRRNGDLAAVHRVAGLLFGNNGAYEKATAEYQRAIELEPGNSDAHRRLGHNYDLAGQQDLAIAELRLATELEPAYHRNHQELGAYYTHRASYTEAIPSFAKAVELAPKEPSTHFALASAYTDSGRFSDAERELQTALVYGETTSVLSSLGLVLIYEGRDQEAIPYLTRALQTGPEKYLTWFALGMAYRRIHLVAEAERANQRALVLAEAEMKTNLRNSYARACAAYLCARLGDTRRADSEIAQALQAAPEHIGTRTMAVLTYEALGRRDDTLTLLQSSPSGLIADVGRFPDLADLARDPRFVQISSLKTR